MNSITINVIDFFLEIIAALQNGETVMDVPMPEGNVIKINLLEFGKGFRFMNSKTLQHMIDAAEIKVT